MSGDEEDSTSKTRYYRLMLYAAIFRAFSSLVTVGYITLYNQGIKFFGQHGGLGVAQSQYAKTGDVNYRNLPGILLQGFIALWSGAAVGPEGTLVFLTGGLGTFVSERLKLQKDDIEVLAYSAIAGAFGIGILLLLMLVKILLTGTSFATGFEGGPNLSITIYRRYDPAIDSHGATLPQAGQTFFLIFVGGLWAIVGGFIFLRRNTSKQQGTVIAVL